MWLVISVLPLVRSIVLPCKRILGRMVLGIPNFSELISPVASCVGCVRKLVQLMRFN